MTDSWLAGKRLRPRQRRLEIAPEPTDVIDTSKEARSPWLITNDVYQPRDDLQDRVDLQDEVDGLRRRLATLPIIEQSKGLLMGHYGVRADVAFAILVRWSSYSNMKLRSLSEQLVAAVSDPAPSRSGTESLQRTIERIQALEPAGDRGEGARSTVDGYPAPARGPDTHLGRRSATACHSATDPMQPRGPDR